MEDHIKFWNIFQVSELKFCDQPVEPFDKSRNKQQLNKF